MTESDRIADQLQRIHAGDPWYGASSSDAVRGLTAGQAAARPLPEAHTVWELVLHMTSWNREVLRRVRTGVWRMPTDGDWPEVPEATEENWRFAAQSLARSFEELVEAVRAFPAERLDEVLGDERDRPLGSGVSYYVTLHGIVQHNVAHTAQISLLRKVLPPS